MNKILLMFLLGLIATAGIATAQSAAKGDYHLVKKIKLGGDGGWDYLEVDQETHRVFIPRDSHMLVLDSDGNVIADMPNFKGAHAVAFAPELKLGFTANDDSRSVTFFDLASLKILKEIKIGAHTPDGILYDPSSQRVFTFNGGAGHDATAIDATTGKIVGTLDLGGKPETAQADGTGKIYVVIQNRGVMVEFEAKTLNILHTWPLGPCNEPAGLAIDTTRHHLFIGCRRAEIMALFDYSTGKALDSIPIGWLVDANRYDPETGLIFASTYDGKITVAREDTPGKLHMVQTIDSQKGARTMALDLKNHNVYAVTADFGPTPAGTAANPRPRPEPLPGTFTMLIFAQ